MSQQDAVRTRECAYNIVIEPAEEGGYVVTCPSLRGLATQGETLEEARAMAADAIEGILSSCGRTGCPCRQATSPQPGLSATG